MACVQFGKLYPQADFIWPDYSVAAEAWVRKGEYYHIIYVFLLKPGLERVNTII